jgi:hypothetical protein
LGSEECRIENNTFVGIGERGVLLIRPGNEVDSPLAVAPFCPIDAITKISYCKKHLRSFGCR